MAYIIYSPSTMFVSGERDIREIALNRLDDRSESTQANSSQRK